MPRRLDRYLSVLPGAVGIVFVASLMFLLLGITILVAENFRDYERRIRAELQLEVYLEEDTTPIELYRLTLDLREIEGYASIKFEDRTQAYREMQALLGQQLLPEGGFNPFPDAVLVNFEPDYASLSNFRSIADMLREYRCVENVNFGEDWMEAQGPVLDFLDVLTTFIALLVFASAIILTYWAVGRSVLAQRERIEIVSELGGGWRHLAVPFMVEGGLLGLVSACVGLLVLYLLWRLALPLPWQLTFISTISIIAIPLSGLLAGLTASYFAVRGALAR
jgi:cell division protein FtsX